jgi:general stress protein 26
MPDDRPLPALDQLVKKQRVGMLTTIRDHQPVSRPVTTLSIEGADQVWFIVAADSSMARDLAVNSLVCLSYASPDDYVSLRGEGAVMRGAAKRCGVRSTPRGSRGPATRTSHFFA